MDEYEVECLDCGWQGYALDLVSKTDGDVDTDFNYCPDCLSGDIQDIENEEDHE